MKKSFHDPVTKILVGHGFTETNRPGDIARDEPDDFNLKPGEWRLEGEQWVAVTAPLAQLKTAKIAEINAKSQAFVDAVTAGYPLFEIETWPKQEAEARAWKADAAAPTPTVDRMAARRKIDRLIYLQKTYDKVVAFELVYDVVGDRQMYVDKVNAIANTDSTTNRNKVAAINPVFPAPQA